MMYREPSQQRRKVALSGFRNALKFLSDQVHQQSMVGRIRGANINTTAYIAVVAGSERILAESINTKFSLYSLSKCLLTALQPKASEQAWIQSHVSVHRGAGGPA